MRTRTLFPTLVCLALAIMVGGCSDSTGYSTPEAGTYILREVNTFRPPVSFSEGASFIAIHSGMITLTTDRTWSERLVVELADVGRPLQTQEVEDSGTYTVKGTTLRLQSTDGDVYSGTVQDGTLTYTISDRDPRIVLTYRK